LLINDFHKTVVQRFRPSVHSVQVDRVSKAAACIDGGHSACGLAHHFARVPSN
jgi:tryptophan synthase beta subunit